MTIHFTTLLLVQLIINCKHLGVALQSNLACCVLSILKENTAWNFETLATQICKGTNLLLGFNWNIIYAC